MTYDDGSGDDVRACCQTYPGDPHAGDCDGSPMTSEADAYAREVRRLEREDAYGFDPEW